MLILIGCYFNQMPCVVAETDYSWITSGDTGDKDFSKKIENFQIEAGTVYKLLLSIVFSLAAVILILVGVKFIANKTGQERKELQTRVWVVILVVCVLLGIGTIFSIAQSIANSIANTGTNKTIIYYAETGGYYVN